MKNFQILNLENTNEQFKQVIDLTNQCIVDLLTTFERLKAQEIKRHILRNLGNTGFNINQNLSSNREKVKTLLTKSWGVNTFENFDRLQKFVKAIHNIHNKRMASGNKGYQDFSKEIAELDRNYKKFMQDRLSSTMTEEYFGY